ncbi:hypothetical protein, partial [Novosphingobium chloroacetimidivorans]|uniref:hypothetical protein n=1 Tax=Novosphingobium chloroacetimidivorans TaxID=1428314 RepID=UPI001C88D685
MNGQNTKRKPTATEPWAIDKLQHDFEKIIRTSYEEGNSLTKGRSSAKSPFENGSGAGVTAVDEGAVCRERREDGRIAP